MKQTVRRHGPKGLYRGMAVFIYGAIPKTGVRFGSYEFIKGSLVQKPEDYRQIHTVIAGTGCGILEAVCVDVPLDTIKVRLIDDLRKKKPRFRVRLNLLLNLAMFKIIKLEKSKT